MAYDSSLRTNTQALSEMVEVIAGSYEEVDSDEDLIELVLDIVCDALSLEPDNIRQRVVETAYARSENDDDDDSDSDEE